MNYNDSFISNDAEAERICKRTCDDLWAAVHRSGASHQSRIEAPPWLQGMAVTVIATPSRGADGKTYRIEVTLQPSKVNPAFDPLRVQSRVASDTQEAFAAVVQPALLAMLREADSRVPSQILADCVWQAGLGNPSHRLYATFRKEYPAKCLELGARPVYSAQKPDQARALLAWLTEWAKAHSLALPDVSFLEGWGVLPPHIVDDPFTLSLDAPASIIEQAVDDVFDLSKASRSVLN